MNQSVASACFSLLGRCLAPGMTIVLQSGSAAAATAVAACPGQKMSFSAATMMVGADRRLSCSAGKPVDPPGICG